MNKLKPVISVVVPIYDTERFLEQCLQSILDQTLENIEVICVDDCSPDNSVLIVQKFQKKDPRIKLIRHKVNTGQGGARNTAIRAAKADFIASVDSDDSIKPEMLETLWEASNKGEFDIVCCGFSRVDDKGNVIHESKFKKREVIREVLSNKLGRENQPDINMFTLMNPSFWNKIWRKSLFIENDIFFPHKLYYQDMATIPLLVANSRRIKFIDKSLYNYLVRDGSVTNTYSDKHIIDYFKIYSILYNQLHRLEMDSIYLDQLFEYIDAGMKFHSTNVVNSPMLDSDKHQYLRHLLMMKVAFIESHSHLVNKSEDELLDLLRTASAIQDIKPIFVEELEDSTKLPTDSSYTSPYIQGVKGKLHQDSDNQREKEVSGSLKKEIKHLGQKLSVSQRNGSKLFGIAFFLLMSPPHKAKLKADPQAFFSDSKNKFTRFVGKALKII